MSRKLLAVSVVLTLMFLIYFVFSIAYYNGLIQKYEELSSKYLTLENSHTALETNYQALENDYEYVDDVYCNTVVELDELRAMDNTRVLTVDYEFTEDEVYLLAQCVEAEAGEFNFNSQRYITQVILNRVYSTQFPNTIREVIYECNGGIPQFSVAYNGFMDRVVRAETLVNVYKVLNHGTDLPKNVLFFYSTIVENNWVNTLPIYTTVEGTVFAYAN